MDEVLKRCNKCLEDKTMESFHKNNRLSDGHVNCCRECFVIFYARPKKKKDHTKRHVYCPYCKCKTNSAEGEIF